MLVFLMVANILFTSCSSNLRGDNMSDILVVDDISYAEISDLLIDIQDIGYDLEDNVEYDILTSDSVISDTQDIADFALDVYEFPDGGGDTYIIPELTPEIIGFESGDLPQNGSLIFYNNWALSGEKDSIEMLNPDSDYKAVRMYAIRVWSFDVSKNGRLIVFSTNDPYQLERYGLTVYDAVENSWLVDERSKPVQISFGPVNDECHNFISDENLMMCRRANFRPDPQYMAVSDPYRILLLNLSNLEEEYLTPLDERYNDYYGSIRSDGILIFNRNIIADRTIDIMTLDLLNNTFGLLLEDASGPVLSADGNEVLFKKKGQNKIFLSDSKDLSKATPVLDGGGNMIGRYVFSPDGERIAYTLEDRINNCSDLMVANRNGSNIRKVLDCYDEKKFITVIKWVFVE